MYAPEENLSIFRALTPIDEVVDNVSTQFGQIYVTRVVSEGGSEEEAEANYTSMIQPQLETLLRERREESDNIAVFGDTAAYHEKNQELNDFIQEYIDEDVDAVWEQYVSE